VPSQPTAVALPADATTRPADAKAAESKRVHVHGLIASEWAPHKRLPIPEALPQRLLSACPLRAPQAPPDEKDAPPKRLLGIRRPQAPPNRLLGAS
jgi:hypothetical protein